MCSVLKVGKRQAIHMRWYRHYAQEDIRPSAPASPRIHASHIRVPEKEMLSARDQDVKNVMAYHKAKYHDKIHDRLLAYIRYDYGRSG